MTCTVVTSFVTIEPNELHDIRGACIQKLLKLRGTYQPPYGIIRDIQKVQVLPTPGLLSRFSSSMEFKVSYVLVHDTLSSAFAVTVTVVTEEGIFATNDYMRFIIPRKYLEDYTYEDGLFRNTEGVINTGMTIEAVPVQTTNGTPIRCIATLKKTI